MKKNKLKQILVIYTGGTIGMMQQPKTRVLVPFDFSEIAKFIPELKQLNCQIHFYFRKNPIDSSNVDLSFWTEIASVIEKNYSKFDGFVILHGTDTMAYTASVLSFMLENLNKPVILTGSQVPLGAIRNDARRNIITSLEIASSETIVPEVCIYFNNHLFRGNRSEKFNSSKFDAYQTLNYPVLAESGVNIEFDKGAIRKTTPGKNLKVIKKLDPNVALIKLFPSLSVQVIEAILNSPGLRAVVLETYGSGNASTNKYFINALKTASKRGIILTNVSQCSGGSVTQGKYATSIQLKEIGVISGHDLTTEAAISKLMFLLGNHHDKKTIEKLFQKDLRGEMTEG